MKAHWLSVLSATGMILLAGSVFGGGLQWKKPVDSEPVGASVICIPTVISTDDVVEPSAILQVQRAEPIQPPRIIPPSAEQLDRIYPELRPQSNTPPAGATIGTTVRVAPQVPLSPDDMSTRTTERLATERPHTVCNDKVALKSIRGISHDIRPTQTGELPEECVIDGTPYYGRHFDQSCFMWKASAVSTKAAYFEDVQLERYGHTIVCPALQPVVSGAKFFATIPMLPYKMGVTPPNECVYTLGHYRSGSCSPYMVEPFPISARGALFEAGAVAGAVLAIP